jgi:hypothetical protein
MVWRKLKKGFQDEDPRREQSSERILDESNIQRKDPQCDKKSRK